MDDCDKASEYEQKWPQAQIDEHAYQINCQAKLDDGRAYCDKDCATDFNDRQRMSKRTGR